MTTKAVTRREWLSQGAPVVSPRPQNSVGGIASSAGSGTPRHVPMFIPAEEAYYWSRQWQEDVFDSMRALRAGEFEEFDSDDPNDVARWLLTVDEDDSD